MINILFIEPHGDDLICSASSLLRSKDVRLDVITLSERTSEGLESLYSSVNRLTYLDLPDLSYYDRPKVSTHDIHRRFLQDEHVYDYYYDLVKQSYGDTFEKTMNDISEALYGMLLNSIHTYDYIVCPLGLCHPYHIAVRYGIDRMLNSFSIINTFEKFPQLVYCVDKPYYQSRYVSEMCSSKISLESLHTVTSPEVDKESIVLETFKQVYPTELGMMRFSSEILTKAVDTYLFKNDTDNFIIRKFEDVLC